MRSLVFVLAFALLIPTAAAAPPQPAYPEELLSLLPAWVAEAQAMATAEDREHAWWDQTQSFLDRAVEAQAGGHFRTTLFHLETYRELLLGNRLIDEGRALGHDSEARSLVLQRTYGVKQDAERAWTAYRATLHEYEPDLSSLLTIEKALYSADVALNGALALTEFDGLAEAFPKQPGFSESYVFGLVRASYTPLLDIAWANELLAKAVEEEGLPPRINAANWANLTGLAMAYGRGGAPPAYLESLDKVGLPVKENGEGLLSVSFLLAEQRASRANNMQTIFGDANSRGLNVLQDASRSMSKQFNNTTLETPRAFGLEGIFTSDAIDRVLLTQEYLAQGSADLGTVIVAWSGLEYANYATTALGGISPIQPPPVTPASTDKAAPGASLVALIGIVGVAALVTMRKRR